MAWQINNRDPKTGLYNATNNGKPGLGQKAFNTGHETGQLVRGIVSPAGVSLDGKNQRARRDNSRRQDAAVIPALFARYGQIDFGGGLQNGAAYYATSLNSNKAVYLYSLPALSWVNYPDWFAKRSGAFYTVYGNYKPQIGEYYSEFVFAGETNAQQQINAKIPEIIPYGESGTELGWSSSASLFPSPPGAPTPPGSFSFFSIMDEKRTGVYNTSFQVLDETEIQLTGSVAIDYVFNGWGDVSPLTTPANQYVTVYLIAYVYSVSKNTDQNFDGNLIQEGSLIISNAPSFASDLVQGRATLVADLPQGKNWVSTREVVGIDDFSFTAIPGNEYHIVFWGMHLSFSQSFSAITGDGAGSNINSVTASMQILAENPLYPVATIPTISAIDENVSVAFSCSNYVDGADPFGAEFSKGSTTNLLSAKLVLAEVKKTANISSFDLAVEFELDPSDWYFVDLENEIPPPVLNAIRSLTPEGDIAISWYGDASNFRNSLISFPGKIQNKAGDPDLQRQALRGRQDGNFVENTDKFYFVENFEETVLPATKTLKNIQVSVADVSEDGDLGTPKKAYKRALPFKFGACPYPAEFVADRVVAIAPTSK